LLREIIYVISFFMHYIRHLTVTSKGSLRLSGKRLKGDQ
jgi:hypothetical protein